MLSKCLLSVAFAAVLSAQTAATSCAGFLNGVSDGEWTITAAAGNSTRLYMGAEIPSIYATNDVGTGVASFPCAVGTQDFAVQADVYINNAWARTTQFGGIAIGLTTALPGSLGASDVSLVAEILSAGGPALVLWGGNLQSNWATSANRIAGESISSLGESFSYPQSANINATIPAWRWTVKLSRDASSNITVSMYADEYQFGTVPYYSYSFLIPAPYQSKSFQYFSILTLGTGGIAGAANNVTVQVNNIRVQAGVTGAPPTIAAFRPSSPGGTFQSGNPVTITGGPFDNSSAYALNIGDGSTFATVTPSYVDSSHLTATLPTESNGSFYKVHLVRNGVDEEYTGNHAGYPGVYYSAAILQSIYPFEVLPTPANSADATVTFTGAGFDNTCSVTFAGKSAAVTYIDPTSLSVVVPSGTQGAPRVILTCDAATVYDSNTSGTYPPTGKINFGYAGHPYLQFTTGSLPAIQAKWTDSTFSSYVGAVNTMLSIDQSWAQLFDYAYRSILSGSAADYATYKTLLATSFPADVNANGAAVGGEINRVNFFFFGAPFGLQFAIHVAEFYDAFFPSLSPAERTQYEQYLVRAASYFNYARLKDPSGAITGTTSNNRIAVAQAGGGYVNIALYNSLQTIRSFSDPISYTARTPSTALSTATTGVDAQLVSYSSLTIQPDGGCVEGTEYCTYGLTPWLIYARARVAQLGSDTPGFFSSNYQHIGSFVNAMWDGAAWATFNDTQPLQHLVPLMVDAGQRYSTPNLLFMVDWMMYTQQFAVGSAYLGGGNAYPCTNCVIGQQWAINDFFTYGTPYAQMWRTAPGTAALGGWPSMSLLSSTVWGGLRSQPILQPDFYFGLKGKQVQEISGGGHDEQDTCTFSLSSRQERFLVDPGYTIPSAINHNSLSVDGNLVGTSGSGSSHLYVTSFDSTVNNGAWMAVPQICTSAWPTGVTALRRTQVMYVNGKNRFAINLDDITPVGAGAIIEYLQSSPAVSNVSSAGFTMTAQRSAMKVTFDGPTRTVAQAAGSPSFCPNSWVYCSISNPVNYTTITVSYTNDVTAPMLTMLAPANLDGTGAMTAMVDRSTPGTIVITLSDGSTATFTNGSGVWKMTSTYVAGAIAG